MIKKWSVFLVISLFWCVESLPLVAQTSISPAGLTDQYQLSIKFGDQFYLSREVPGNARKALKYYHQALALKPDSGDVYWRLSRAMYGVYRAELDPKKKKEMILQGIEYAEKAVELDPKNVEAHLFLGLNYGQYALQVGLWRAWYYIFPVKREMEIILEMDPQNPYAHIILGTWYFTVPWWLGGNNEKGTNHAYQAIQYQPDYTSHFLHLSTHLLELGRKKEATQVLRQMFQIEKPFDPMIAIEDRMTAKQLIKKHQLQLDFSDE